MCRNDVEGALSSLDEALRLSPDFSEALELKSSLLLDMGRAEELGDLLRPLINHEHHRSFAYAKLAESLLDQKKSSMALDVAETAVKFDQTNLSAFLALGRARLNFTGDRDGAQRAFRKCAAIGRRQSARARACRVDRTFRRGFACSDALCARARMARRSGDLVLVGRSQRTTPGDASQAAEAYQSAVADKPYLVKAQLGLASWRSKKKPH